MQAMPDSRGPLSALLLERLTGPPAPFPSRAAKTGDWEDLQLALYLCYEMHYLGVERADAGWEWEPSLLHFRRTLEQEFIDHLTHLVPRAEVSPGQVEERLRGLSEEDGGPSLSDYLASEASLWQFREFVVHRSLYHLKEADPHSWAIPRLHGPPKAALIEIQADEYGGGRFPWMHSNLFGKLMREIGLDPSYGAYLDAVPGDTLATVNLMSMFGLHRRWRAALVGHLALFEMTSSGPNRLYGEGLRRLGFGDSAALFYDEHVEADSLHEAVAAHDLAAGLALQQPELSSDIIFGAECLAALDGQFARLLLSSWKRGATSLRVPLAETEGAPEIPLAP